MDEAYLELLLWRIVHGELHMEKRTQSPVGGIHVSFSDFRRSIRGHTVVFVFRGPQPNVDELFRQTRRDLGRVRMLLFDVAENEIPEEPIRDELPYFVVYPRGNLAGGFIYDGPLDWSGFINTVNRMLD
jgi:hypothetical protein